MYHPFQDKSIRPNNFNGRSKFNNSDNIKSIFDSSSDIAPSRKAEAKDPKEINRTSFSRDIYKKALTEHAPCHRKGNIALRDGKVFYLK